MSESRGREIRWWKVCPRFVVCKSTAADGTGNCLNKLRRENAYALVRKHSLSRLAYFILRPWTVLLGPSCLLTLRLTTRVK
jgi:hypothetical protein